MDGLLNTFKNLGPTRIIMLIAVTLVTMAMLAILVTRINAPNLTLLYGNLDSKTASNIVTKLDQQNIPYEVRGESAIYVPADQVSSLRLKIAGEGVVGGSQGGYEILDNASSFGTTALVQDINARRALEGELARTIVSIPAVDAARVHLVIPKKRVFITDEAEATASVTLDLGSRILSAEQVQAITHLVAASVPGLLPQKVTVVDNRGNLLTSEGDMASATSAMTATNKYKATLEADYATSLTKMLEHVVGAGKVSIRVNADVDFDRIEENAEIYDPTQQVARSEQQIEETSSASAGGPADFVGASSNLPDGGADGEQPPALISPKDTTSRTEATTNYEISKILRKSVKEGGRLKRLSIAVLVEGKYNTVDGQTTYVPWSTDDLAKFRSLVQSSIGFDETRGDKLEVLDLPFTSTPEEPAVDAPLLTKADMMHLAEYALLVVGLALMGLFVIKPLLKVITSPAALTAAGPIIAPRGAQAGQPLPNIGMAHAPEEPDEPLINLDKVAGKVRESSIRKVGEIVSQHSDESISVIRQWVAQSSRSDSFDEQ